MENWKHAWWLARFELKVSKRGFLLLPLVAILFAFDFRFNFGAYLENSYFAVDILFLLIFTVAPVWVKPKNFQIQKMNDGLLVAPPIVRMQQLPVSKDIIAKSRFIIYFVHTAPVQIFWLMSLYLLTPVLQDMLTVPLYVSFAIIWLSFSIYIGSIFAVSDAGEKASSLKIIVYGLLMIIVAVVLFTFIQRYFDYGIVHWTIIFAQKWPITSALLSILLAVIGFNYWQSYMKKIMGKLDYL